MLVEQERLSLLRLTHVPLLLVAFLHSYCNQCANGLIHSSLTQLHGLVGNLDHYLRMSESLYHRMWVGRMVERHAPR